jgi:hypothetical protein
LVIRIGVRQRWVFPRARRRNAGFILILLFVVKIEHHEVLQERRRFSIGEITRWRRRGRAFQAKIIDGWAQSCR